MSFDQSKPEHPALEGDDQHCLPVRRVTYGLVEETPTLDAFRLWCLSEKHPHQRHGLHCCSVGLHMTLGPAQWACMQLLSERACVPATTAQALQQS